MSHVQCASKPLPTNILNTNISSSTVINDTRALTIGLTDVTPITQNNHGMATSSKAGIFKPQALIVARELYTVSEALQSPEWKSSMKD